MSIHDHPASHDVESLLGQVAGEFIERLQRGEQPVVDEYAKRYPEIAHLIEDVLPALGMICGPEDESQRGSLRSPSRTPEKSAPKTIGDFRIIREIGRGGMGVVFEAEQLSMDRKVALKILPLAYMLDEKRLARFKNEVRAAALFDHPNIVSIYSVGEERGIHYYAMQLVRGQSMAHVIAQLRSHRSRLSAESIFHAATETVIPRPAAGTDPARSRADQAPRTSNDSAPRSDRQPPPTPTSAGREYYRAIARLGRQVADALQHAHEHGVVHRDIKPANLLLDSKGHVWVTDFGLARIEADAGLTMSGDVLGTFRYMAPEQAGGSHEIIDHRADVYSLGVTLYELVSLEPALHGTDYRKMLKQIAQQEPTALRKLAPSVPIELATIISKAIEKNPSDRYTTAKAMADDLERFLDDVPIKAKPPTLVERAVKWSRRHSDLAWVAVVAMLLATIGAIGAAALLNRSYNEVERQRQVADRMRGKAESHRAALQQEVYSLDMQAAFEAYHDGRFDRVEPLLQKHEPRAGDTDVRTFSWYALQEMTLRPQPIVLHGVSNVPHESMIVRPAIRVMRGHDGAVREVSVHPDGERLVTVGDDGTIRTWNVANGSLLATIQTENDPLHALSISPDGSQVLTGHKTLQLWDLERGQLVANLTDFETTIEEVAFSPDGAFVAAGSRDSVVKLITLSDRQVRQFDVKSPNESLTFTGDGASITAVCKYDASNRVQSWNVKSGQLVRDFAVPRYRTLAILVPIAGGRQFAIANSVEDIVFWDDAKGKVLGSAAAAIDDLFDLKMSPDNAILVGGCNNGSLCVWRMNPRWLEYEVSAVTWGEPLVLPAHADQITSLAFVDGHRLASASADGTIKIWQVGTPRIPSFRLENELDRAAFMPDAKSIVASDHEGHLQRRDVASNRIAWRVPHNRDALLAIECAADGSRCATFTDDDTIDVWNLDPPHRVTTIHHQYDVNSVAMSPAGRRVAATCVDGYTTVWDVETSTDVFSLKLDSWGNDVEFSPAGDLLALGGRVPDILLLRTDSWRVVGRLRGVSDMQMMTFDRDGARLASIHKDKVIRIWNLGTGELACELDASDLEKAYCLAFHPSDQTLVVGVAHETVSVWHLPTGKQHGGLFRSIRSELRHAQDVAFSPDGRAIFALIERRKFFDKTVLALETDFPIHRSPEP